MTAIIIIGILALLAIVVVQIGKLSDLRSKIMGEEDINYQNYDITGKLLLFFMIGFLIFCVVSAYYYKNWMLGYGPHESASIHGHSIDSMFDTTLIYTGIVFFVTQILLFWYAFKYRSQRGSKAIYFPGSTKLELIWSIVPSIVLVILVARGLIAWNDIMADTKAEDNAIEIEATAFQFAWNIRYAGNDGVIGTKNYKKITPLNALGQDFNDIKNLDDFNADEIVLPVGRKVRVRIIAKDVLHNFYLPQFRVKMDAVPGLPTFFVFTPTTTTEEYRERLRKYKEYQVPSDPLDPTSEPLWKAFNYELACAELCGQGHYSMRRLVKIVSEQEYESWKANQKSTYLTNIRNTDEDPFKGQVLDIEVKSRRDAFFGQVDKILKTDSLVGKQTIKLEHIQFETGSDKLTPDSKYELDNLIELMVNNSGVTLEVAGHTDNTGDAGSNLDLSNKRALAVKDYMINRGVDGARLKATGYGQSKPIDSNDTPEGRQNNRRTEFKILTK
ncbi:MAG: OmpA family protein [Saprospiraceae bacterium]|nr:OmpA family protein [Saprospiraceae bacterium]MBK8511428.1 OmpA family protein [Saprospiraceae bacterium]MBK8777586.1 OmpA family protein [Saprospiraceae bacterium]